MATTRNPNFEMLRVLAMLMVLTLHSCNYGGLLFLSPATTPPVRYGLIWLLESLSFVCINLYVLISSYFMVGSTFRLSRIAKLWLITLFYSLTVGLAVCLIAGETFHWQWALPVSTGEYWFVTDYLLLCLVAPFLNRLIHHVSQRALFRLLMVLAMLFVVLPTLLYPFVSTDIKLNDGFHIGWFIVLYFFGAYLRLYPLPARRPSKYFATYLALSLLTVVLWLGVQPLLSGLFGPETPAWRPYAYNSVTVFAASLCLFLMFLNLRPRPDAAPVRFIVRLAPFAFSVYLIHMQPSLFPHIWTDLLNLSRFYASPWLLPITLGTNLILFLLLCGVDFLRDRLFCLLQVDPLLERACSKLEREVRSIGDRVYLRLTGKQGVPTTGNTPDKGESSSIINSSDTRPIS